MNYEAWIAELLKTAIASFFFSPEAAAQLQPAARDSWRRYYEEGYGPEAALEEDLAHTTDSCSREYH